MFNTSLLLKDTNSAVIESHIVERKVDFFLREFTIIRIELDLNLLVIGLIGLSLILKVDESILDNDYSCKFLAFENEFTASISRARAA